MLRSSVQRAKRGRERTIAEMLDFVAANSYCDVGRIARHIQLAQTNTRSYIKMAVNCGFIEQSQGGLCRITEKGVKFNGIWLELDDLVQPALDILVKESS